MFDLNRSWLVFGHFGGRNFGDEVMLRALVAGGAEHGQYFRVLVPSSAPDNSGENWTTVSLKPMAALRALWGSDGLVMANGSSFHDGYRGARHLRHLITMAMMLGVILMARLLGKSVVWVSVSIVPNRRFMTRLVTGLAVRASHRVILRDLESVTVAEGMGLARRVTYGADLAPLFSESLKAKASKAPVRRRVGLSLVPADLVSTASPEAAAAFLEALQDGLAALLATDTALELAVFVVGRGDHDDDMAVSEAIHARLAAVAPARVSLVKFDGDPEPLALELAACGAVIAMRLHAAMVSELFGVPTLWVAYHRKLIDAAAELGLPPESVMKPDGAMAAERALAELERLRVRETRPDLRRSTSRSALNIDALQA